MVMAARTKTSAGLKGRNIPAPEGARKRAGITDDTPVSSSASLDGVTFYSIDSVEAVSAEYADRPLTTDEFDAALSRIDALVDQDS